MYRLLILATLLGLVFGVQSVGAQEAEASGLSYVIQPGDTLSSVANRFGLSIEAIVEANELANPDQIQSGTVLELPGVLWVQGTLDRRFVPFGETMRTLGRRYQTSNAVLARLNGAASPGQFFVGYPAMLPTESGELLDGGRGGLAQEESILEFAIRQGVSQWALAGRNQLKAPGHGLPGDVWLLPGIPGSGPGGLPSPISELSLSALPIRQGKTVVVRASAGGAEMSIGGVLVDKPLNFFGQADGSLAALQGVHALLPEGLYPFSVSGTMPDGSDFSFAQLVAVTGGGYSSERLTVAPEYLDDARAQQESEFVASITAPVTLEKYWSGLFVLPTPFGDVINSVFGTRRSFNGSPYDYFHSGVDWGGGEGAEVFSAARGVVVFADLLDVRGNATIIDHGWGIYSGYWHQSRIDVQVGQVVEPGQLIGLVGNTGRSTGAHLHWEVWVGGVQVEPLDWLNRVFP